MSDQDGISGSPNRTAGAMLREARQARGLHIGALSALMKVPQRKLELLEADRLSELPDATFARALAQSMCRSLKIDPAPVLAALPQVSGHRLEAVDEGIKLPFRDKPGLQPNPSALAALMSPAIWGPALIVAATVFVYLMPADWVSRLQGLVSRQAAPTAVAPAPEPSPAVPEAASQPVAAEPTPASASAAVAAASAGSASAGLVETVHTAPDDAPRSEASASAAVAGPLQLKVSEPSWVEVRDARAQVLLSRSLQPGETVTLDGSMPFRITVGNAAATQLVLRGVPVDLSASTRDNVARLELK